MTDHGPYETERDALAAARHITATQPGTWQQGSLDMLLEACRSAGVQTGAYGFSVLSHLAGGEPQQCAVVADLITRAYETGRAQPPRERRPRLRETEEDT